MIRRFLRTAKRVAKLIVFGPPKPDLGTLWTFTELAGRLKAVGRVIQMGSGENLLTRIAIPGGATVRYQRCSSGAECVLVNNGIIGFMVTYVGGRMRSLEFTFSEHTYYAKDFRLQQRIHVDGFLRSIHRILSPVRPAQP